MNQGKYSENYFMLYKLSEIKFSVFTLWVQRKKKEKEKSKVDLRIIENAWIWQVGKITEYLI